MGESFENWGCNVALSVPNVARDQLRCPPSLRRTVPAHAAAIPSEPDGARLLEGSFLLVRPMSTRANIFTYDLNAA